MRKVIIISCISGSLFIIALQCGFFNALALFLLAGIIPGTNIALSANVMFALLILIAASIVLRLIWTSRYKKVIMARFITLRDAHKKRLPKRRFQQI